jgi:hypothetical protein
MSRGIYESLKLEYPVPWTGMKSFPAEGRDKYPNSKHASSGQLPSHGIASQ